MRTIDLQFWRFILDHIFMADTASVFEQMKIMEEEQLKTLTRRELQQMAKRRGIKANKKVGIF